MRLINAGFWGARTLSSAVEVGLVGRLAEQDWTLIELAEACDVSPRGTEAVVRFLTAFGFAEQVGERFRLTAAARRLWFAEPSALRTEAQIAPRVWAAMEGLTDALRDEAPVEGTFFDRLNDTELAGFAATMEVQARRLARPLTEAIDLAGRHRLLDLGGGSGYLASQISNRYPALDVVVLDRPETVAYALKEGPLPGVTMVAGDFWTTDANVGHDVLLLSRVLHDWDDAHVRRLLDRWVRPMPAEGMVIVCEEMLSPVAGPERQSAALLDIFLFAVIGGGRVRTPGQMADLLMQAGCDAIERRVLSEGSTLLLSLVQRR